MTGTAQLDGKEFGVAVMDSRFRMGVWDRLSVKRYVASLITALRTVYHLFFSLQVVVHVCKKVLFPLMQMGKTSVSLKRHSDAGLLYISYSNIQLLVVYLQVLHQLVI